MSGACAVVFPGQGSQRPGMARDFHGAFRASAEVFAEVSDALGLDMGELCFRDDPRLGLTEFAQPAILTAEIAMLRALEAELGLRPTHFGGHSLGEYTALVAAGAVPLAQAARLVRERGRRMQEAVPAGQGGMIALTARALEPEELARCLEGLPVDVANLNAPGQVVLSGLHHALESAAQRLRGMPAGGGIQARKLAVSAPFHSRLMAPIEPGFRELLAEASAAWRPERAAAVVSNYTGGFHTGDRAALVDALVRQISSRVRWIDDMRALSSVAAERIVEVGPTSHLRGLFNMLRVRVDAVTTAAAARQAFQP